MSFDFAAVVRDKTILALYASSKGNFDVITVDIIGGIDQNETRATRERGQSRYFISHDGNGLYFIVGCDSHTDSSEAFDFLQGLKRKFILQFSRAWKNAPIYGMQQEFGMQIKQMIDNKTNSKIAKIKENLEETQEVMTNTMEMAILRDSQLSEIENKTNLISSNANLYERSARTLKRKACFEKYRYYIIGISTIIVVLFLIVVISCGGFSFEKCKKSASK